MYALQEFATGHPSRHEFLARGREFLRTAEEAHAAGRLGPSLDTAFSAAELLAKAELLSCRPTVELILNRKKHEAIAQPYHAWSHLGNTDGQFAKLLQRLGRLRGQARYLDGEIVVTTMQAADILATLRRMEEHVSRVVTAGQVGDVPASFNVYATRAIKAGELVGAATSP